MTLAFTSPPIMVLSFPVRLTPVISAMVEGNSASVITTVYPIVYFPGLSIFSTQCLSVVIVTQIDFTIHIVFIVFSEAAHDGME